MKKLLIVGALAATALVYSQPSQAYFRGNWCAKLDVGGGVVQERCDFTSFAACRAYMMTQTKSTCTQNQWSARNWGVDEDRDGNRFNSVYR